VTQIDMKVVEAGDTQRLDHQAQHFDVALDARVAVELGTDLQWIARTRKTIAARVEYCIDVTQSHRKFALEVVGVDTCNLRGHIGPHPHQTTRRLVDQFESLKVEIMACANQQRLQVLDQRRDDQFVTPAVEGIQQFPSQSLEAQRLRRQVLVDTFR